jgi:hypothetical protein
MTILLTIVIILLACYVVYLHVLLDKRNMHILRIEEGMRGLKSSWNEKIFHFLHSEHAVVSKQIDDNRFRDFLFENEKMINIYIHYTREREVAEKIMNDGFFFESSLYKTTEIITNDRTELLYKHYLRKQYGENVVVLCISKDLYKKCQEKIKKHLDSKKNFPEHLLSKPVRLVEEDMKGFILPTQYVKGFFNYASGETVMNSKFNPNFDPTANIHSDKSI